MALIFIVLVVKETGEGGWASRRESEEGYIVDDLWHLFSSKIKAHSISYIKLHCQPLCWQSETITVMKNQK